MNREILRNLIFFSTLLVAIISAFTYLLVQGRQSLMEHNTVIMHSYEVIEDAKALSQQPFSLLSNARNYLLTRDKNYETRYHALNTSMLAQTERLTKMIAVNPDQIQNMERVQRTMLLFLSEVEGLTLAITENESPLEKLQNTTTRIEERRGELDNAFTALIQHEKKLMDTRQADLNRERDNYYSSLITCGVLGAIMLISFNGILFFVQLKRVKAEKLLQESNRRFELAVYGATDAIFDISASEDKVYYSKQFFEMLGRPEATDGLFLRDLMLLVHPDDQKNFWDRLSASLNSETSEYSDTFRLSHKSGHWVWVNSRGRVIRGTRNKIERLIGATTDITYMRIYQEKVEAEKEAAKRADKAKGAFLAHMSHEIRTPLTAIVGASEILNRNQENLTSKQKKLLDVLRSSAISLRELVTGILDFSRIESGELTLDERDTNLGDLLQEVADIASISAQEKHLAFSLDSSRFRYAQVLVDPTRLRQILVNLISNAIKFTNKGSVTITPGTIDIEGNPFLYFAVQDTGIGIAPDKITTVFERFQQADTHISTKYGGTGLGLSISQDLVRLMGGYIKVESELDKGSTFTLYVPYRQPVDQHELATTHNPATEAISEKKYLDRMRALAAGQKRVLIAEDYEGNILIITSLLEEVGLKCDVAHNGEEAIRQWKANHYDIVLMDVKMPIMDGYTATTEIRRLEAEAQLPRTPIICMTAHAMMQNKSSGIKAGMDDYLAKPVAWEELLGIVYKYINRKNAA